MASVQGEKGEKMRLIDAEEAYKVLTDYYHHKTEIQHKALKEAIGRVPTVDAVEVVRCNNCAYWDATEKVCVDMMTADENGFCSWGERRKDG